MQGTLPRMPRCGPTKAIGTGIKAAKGITMAVTIGFQPGQEYFLDGDAAPRTAPDADRGFLLFSFISTISKNYAA